MQTQRRLDHAHHPRRPLQVPKVAFCRAYNKGPLSSFEDVGQRPDFKGVAQRRPGSVRFYVRHIFRHDPGPLDRRPDHLFLGGPVGCRERGGAAVLVDG
eukprot:3520868-Rhodomonas_salina.1